ncbi:hypothetical protein BFP70_09635 [Thioclava sp. SK-1]|uniref:hypothetical protein n=1 Tax=Thioclava sp. SK-1 TaxID=1889770 RepID=UPI000825A71A|nr:hypothetical protein [Thioclava sp. SK-1]OCX65319.1 hypothetical protein BFP70_09635 [Thioclava sp. SK-1]
MTSVADLKQLQIRNQALSTRGIMMLGFQRTNHISTEARLAWENGDRAPLRQEARTRRDEIFQGALADIHSEYLGVQSALKTANFAPKTVIDIGCGQALGDAFLLRDFDPAFILIDIEKTPSQYHAWKKRGSGYALLDEAAEFLRDNGARQVRTINPRLVPDQLNGLHADLVISTISCGFHYPIGEYLPIMLASLERGGTVILDIRQRYWRNPDEALNSLLSHAQHVEIPSAEPKAHRLLFTSRPA